jgi:hypothetical protein
MDILATTLGEKPSQLKLAKPILMAIEEMTEAIHDVIGKFGVSELSKNAYDCMAQRLSLLLTEAYLKEYYDSQTGKLLWKRGEPNAPIPIEYLWTAKALLSLELVRQSSLIHTARGHRRDESWDFAKALVRRMLRRKGA